jgi:3-carboxy-cis,cis-muconate cycloisomerase
LGLAKAGRLDKQDAAALVAQIEAFAPAPIRIAEAAVTDGVPVPEYIRQLRKHVSGPGADMLHFGATSQDLVDTAIIEALLKAISVVTARLDHLITAIEALEARDGENTLKAITRMQEALTIRVSDRLGGWRQPLEALRDRLPRLGDQVAWLQFGGAVGDLQALGADAGTIAQAIAGELDLRWPGHGWQTSREPLIAAASWLTELSGALGKIGQDAAIMALRGAGDIELSGGGTSSAMPHKQNPVTAERLVAFARFNASQMGTMHQARIHEMERSGAAMTLEWMILPQICETTGAGLTAATALMRAINRMGTAS